MSSTVEFILKLKDMVSGSMRAVAATTQSVVGRINTTVTNGTRSIDSMNRRLDDLRRTRDLSIDTRQIREANREMDRLERHRDRLENSGRGRSSGGGGLGGMLGMGRGMLLAGGVAAAAMGVGKVASMGMDAGRIEASMKVGREGPAAGAQLYRDLDKFAKDSIFGNEIFKDAQTMKGFGIQIKEILPDLKMLGDISQGDGQRLESLTLAFSQSQAAGRLMGQDLLQMINAGFNPLQELSRMTGLSMATLKKRMEEGVISADLVKKAFQHATGPAGDFYKMTEKIGETPFGKWEATKGQVEGAFKDMGVAMGPAISQVLTSIKPLLDMLPSALSRMQPVFGLIADIAGRTVQLMPQIAGALQPLINVVAAGPIRQLLDDVGGLASIFIGALAPILQEISPLVSTLFEVTASLAHVVFKTASGILKSLAPALRSITHIVSVVLTPVLRIVGPILEGIVKFLGWILDKAAKVLSAIANVVDTVVSAVSSVVDGAISGIQSLLGISSSAPAVVASNLKQINNSDTVSFLKKMGEEHGDAYAQGVMSQNERLAGFYDKMFYTNANTKRAAEVRKLYQASTAAPAGATTGAGKFSAGTTDLSGSSAKVNGGGVRAINISIGKFWEDLVFNVSDTKEAAPAAGDQVAQGINRILYSIGQNM